MLGATNGVLKVSREVLSVVCKARFVSVSMAASEKNIRHETGKCGAEKIIRCKTGRQNWLRSVHQICGCSRLLA
jgi:predicted RNA-binding Zn-ribbon protein involved in translation (DUF1610 family)